MNLDAGLAIGQRRGGERGRPLDRGGRQRLGQQGRAAVDELDGKRGELLVGARAIVGGDDVSGISTGRSARERPPRT